MERAATPENSRSGVVLLTRLVRTSRPIGWVAAVALYRGGMAYAGADDTWVTLGLTLALAFPFGLYLFGLNDVSDAESDRVNPRKGDWLHGAQVSEADLRLVRNASLAAGAVVLFFAPLLPWAAGATLAAVLALGWLYSRPPVRLKEVPIIDGFVTAAIMVGLVGVGYLTRGSLADIPVESYAVAPTLAGLHIYASVADVDSDRAAGHRTLAVRVGPRMAMRVSLLLSLVTAATVPFLEYAYPIVVYVGLQAFVIMLSLTAPRWMTPRRALFIFGVSGILTLIALWVQYVLGV